MTPPFPFAGATALCDAEPVPLTSLAQATATRPLADPPWPAGLSLDESTFSLVVGGERRLLTRQTWAVAYALNAEPGRVITSDALRQAAYGRHARSDNAIRCVLTRLRHAIAGSGWRVKSRHDIGYFLERDAAE